MNFISRLRSQARASAAYLAMRRWQREGFLRAFRRHRRWTKVLKTNPIRTSPHSQSAVEVHVLCHRLDHLPAIWGLKSFYHAAAVDFPLVIHVNGGAEAAIHKRLRMHFPDAKVVSRDEADRVVEPYLASKGLNRLLIARRESPFMLKLTDFSILASGATVLGIDSDILFFTRPEEILARCGRRGDGYLVQTDPTTSYNLTAEEARDVFGIDLVERVNTGILVFPKELPAMEEFDRYLRHPAVAKPTGFIEQTLYAMHGSAIGRIDRLPESRYPVDLRPGLSYENVIARHYAGPSRPLLTTEGMPRVEQASWFLCNRRCGR